MKSKQTFQVCAVNHHRTGGRRLVAIGDAYVDKTGIRIVLQRELRSNLLYLVRQNGGKRS